MGIAREDVAALAARQDQVVTTRQLEELGATRSWVAWRVNQGLWQRLHPGVLVAHSGPVTWSTQAAAALMYAGPGAALSHEAAAYRHNIRLAPPGLVEVSIPHERRVAPSAGIRVVRRRDMPEAFGRIRTVNRYDTVLDLVAQAVDVDAAVSAITAAARAQIHPSLVLKAAARRRSVPRRGLLLELLDEVADGVESALELRYHHDVERRHHLPAAELQVRHRLDGGWIRADRVYAGLGVRVELDGELAHPGGRTDTDVWRDNAVVLAMAEITLRYRWRHVALTPCRTAAQVEQALRSRGWTEFGRPCGAGCALALR